MKSTSVSGLLPTVLSHAPPSAEVHISTFLVDGISMEKNQSGYRFAQCAQSGVSSRATRRHQTGDRNANNTSEGIRRYRAETLNVNVRHKEMRIILIPILFVCLTGCASMREFVTRRTPNVHIAFGTLMPHPELDTVPDLKQYRLDTIVNGNFLTNDYAYVSFRRETTPTNGLPRKAILILHLGLDDYTWYKEAQWFAQGDGDEVSLRSYTAYREDARQGILPDTPENRLYASTVSLRLLGATPRSERLARDAAVSVAREYVLADEQEGVTVKARARRDPYGWSIFCDIIQPDGDQYVGDHCTIQVSDEGGIHIAHRGM